MSGLVVSSNKMHHTVLVMCEGNAELHSAVYTSASINESFSAKCRSFANTEIGGRTARKYTNGRYTNTRSNVVPVMMVIGTFFVLASISRSVKSFCTLTRSGGGSSSLSVMAPDLIKQLEPHRRTQDLILLQRHDELWLPGFLRF